MGIPLSEQHSFDADKLTNKPEIYMKGFGGACLSLRG
jgi:hypothetical protein